MSESSVTAKQAQQKQWMKQWYENNKEYCKEQAQLYYFSHYPEIKERNNAAAKAYYWKNRDKILAKRRLLIIVRCLYHRLNTDARLRYLKKHLNGMDTHPWRPRDANVQVNTNFSLLARAGIHGLPSRSLPR